MTLPDLRDPYAGLLYCAKCGAPLSAVSLPGREEPVMYFCPNEHDEEPCAECGCADECEGYDEYPEYTEENGIMFQDVQALVSNFLESILENVNALVGQYADDAIGLTQDIAADALTLNRLDYEMTHLRADRNLLRHLASQSQESPKDILKAYRTIYREGNRRQEEREQELTEIEDQIQNLTGLAEMLSKEPLEVEDIRRFIDRINMTEERAWVVLKPELLQMLGAEEE